MIRRIIGPLPAWTDRKHPLLSYQMQSGQPESRWRRYFRAFMFILLLLGLLVGGYAYATELFTNQPGQNPTESANRILFFPMVLLHLVAGLLALAMTVDVVGDEQRRGTWENLRATPSGAELMLRARWVLVFYRLRALLIVFVVVRLLLIFGVLRDLTAFQGRYLELLIGGVQPTFPVQVAGVPFAVPMATLLLSLFLTAALLLPFTTLALDTSVGLWLATRFRRRVYTLVIQFLLLLLRVLVVIGLVFVMLQFAAQDLNLMVNQLSWLPLEWLTLFGFSAFADQGIRLLNLSFAGEMWVLIPYSIFVGPLLLVLALGQAFLADFILRRAVHNAQRRG